LSFSERAGGGHVRSRWSSLAVDHMRCCNRMDEQADNTPGGQEEKPPDFRAPFSAPTEAALVRAMMPGAPDRERAWMEFHRRESPRLLGFIAHKLGRDRESEAEDVWSEVVESIELHLKGFVHRGEGSFRSWYLRIAQNNCLSRHRGRKDEPAPHELLSFEELEEQLVAPSSDINNGSGSADAPERVLSDREAAVHDAFATLGAVDQTVIELKFITPTPDKQIAAIVGKPETQIRQIRNKAIKKLRRALERIVSSRKRSA
jgi:RNA polymerase sigma factor (sigma-70 family)